MRHPFLRPLLLLLPLGSAACVDSVVYDKSVKDLEIARHAATQKDEQIRAYQWQMATLGQQLRDAAQRSEALQRDFLAQMQQLTASNANLAERLKKVEGERSSLLAAAAEPPVTGRDGKPSREGPRPDELRRMIAAADARNAQIVEGLARIERLLGQASRSPPGESASARHPAAPADIIDPWGFGSRK